MISHTPIHEVFSLGPFHFYIWGLIFVIAFIVTSFLILREAKRRRIDQNYILIIMLLVLLGAIIGGRLFYVFEHLSYFLANPLEIFAFGKGGETSYGGVIFALLFAWVYSKFSKNKDKLKFSQILDLIAPYVVLTAAIARIGCFFNWCCYGIQSSLPWAIKTIDDVSRHPTQLYELVYCLIIFGLLLWFRNIKETGKLTKFRKLLNKDGALFLFFLIFYSVFRFFNDFLRTYENYFLGLAESQWILIIVFVISVTLMVRIKKKRSTRNISQK